MPVESHQKTIGDSLTTVRHPVARCRPDGEAAFQASLLEAIGQPVFATDLEGTVIYWNDAATDLFGWPRGEILGRSIRHLIAGAHPADLWSDIVTAVSEGCSWKDDLGLRRLDDEPFFGHWVCGGLQDVTEHLVGVVVVTSDLIERKAVEDALRLSGERMCSIFQASVDGICVVSLDGILTFASSSLAALFDVSSPDELIGRRVVDLVVPDDRARIGAEIEHALRAGKAVEVPATILRASGARRQVEVTAAVMYDPTGAPHAFTTVVHDVSERRALENQLRHQAFLDAFLSNMSHELHTPLNAIIGFAELMHDRKVGPITDEQREYLGDVLNSSRRLLEIIDNILDIASLDSGNSELHRVPTDVARIVDDVVLATHDLAENRQIDLTTECDAALAGIMIDPERLKRVLEIYVSNALKFTPIGGSVAIRALAEEPGQFRIEVRDTGIGIHPADLEKLFVEFQQLDAGAAKQYQGAGIGLALTRRIVEAQGGRVGVESTPGEGSTFYAIVPCVFPTGAGQTSARESTE